jgi:hypothetical protein
VAANSNYWQWNVAVERELVRNTVLEVAYVGSKGLDLFGQTNLNEVVPANRLAYAQTGDVTLRPLNGIAGIGDGTLALWQHNRDSIYHSLQVAFVSHFGRSQVSLAYTWSKLIANTGVANADGPGLSSYNAYTDSTQPNLDRARGGNDRTHVFAGSLILALPRLENQSPFVKNVFGDWEFTTIVQAGTGYPITVTTGSVPGLSANGLASGTGQNSGNRAMPNVVSGVSCTLNGSDPTLYLNPAAWTMNGYQIGTNGDSGRNVCNGPSSFEADASIYKNFKVSGRVKLQLRFEVFNVFNTVNFFGNKISNGDGNNIVNYNPGNVVFDTGNGKTATKIISATPAGNFGQLTAAGDPRTAQVGIRLMF